MEKGSMTRRAAAILLFPVLLLLTSCSGTGASIEILRGNLLFRSGEDALATYKYLQAKQRGGDWEDWIDYDLGTLYVSLGEINPGIRVLNRTLEGFGELPAELGRRDRELFYRCYFNLGVARYEIGDYREAAASFVQALRLRADSWDAKINLELSLEAMEKAAAADSVSGSRDRPETLQGSAEEPEDLQRDDLLESIHREERPAWVSAPSQERFEQDW
jgi:tetratricopeptide (TPR) repeat protein